MVYTEFAEPRVCIGENLTTDDTGQLRLQPWSMPRLVEDVLVASGADGQMYPTKALPGKLLIDRQINWRNDAPIEQSVLIRVIRGPRSLVTSNPNAIQFRDRWTFAIDADPVPPFTTGIFNGQFGSAVDIGTNSVAEPQPGRLWMWTDANTSDEWLTLAPDQQLKVWYRAYVWTPPPWSDNANKNNPQHEAYANWARLQLWSFPQQGTVVSG